MMSFNVEFDEYVNTVMVPGVQIFIQDQFDPILPGAMGVVLSPGLIYHISLSKVEIEPIMLGCEYFYLISNLANWKQNFSTN